MTELRLNVGCGPWPAAGWVNIEVDGSPYPADAYIAVAGAYTVGPPWAYNYQRLCAATDRGVDGGELRLLGDELAAIPTDAGWDRIYMGHVVEHMDPPDVVALVASAIRRLAPGGELRIVAPDVKLNLARLVDAALRSSAGDDGEVWTDERDRLLKAWEDERNFGVNAGPLARHRWNCYEERLVAYTAQACVDAADRLGLADEATPVVTPLPIGPDVEGDPDLAWGDWPVVSFWPDQCAVAIERSRCARTYKENR